MSDGRVMTDRTEISLGPGETWVREQVDPQGTLPEVSLDIYRSEEIPDYFKRERVSITHDGEPAGWCNLITDYVQKRMHFDLITLDETAPGANNYNDLQRRNRVKGLGLASYLIAIETAHDRGVPFESQDGMLSLSSNRIWQILVAQSVADIVTNPKIIQRSNGQKVIAKYSAPIHSADTTL